MRYLDKETFAENPGNVTISNKKYYKIKKLLSLNFNDSIYFYKQKKKLNEFMKFGDTQPAIVYSISPLLIAAYSDEMDAVLMLKFPEELAKQYKLTVGTRIVTSNVYVHKNQFGISEDIFIGENYLNRYRDFIPIVALFLSRNESFLKNQTNLFNESTWQVVKEKASEYTKKHPDLYRNGFFYLLK